MLRIDETARTLVAPEQDAFVAEPALDRDELLGLLASSWDAFAGEIGQPSLSLVAVAPAPGVDVLALDESAGRVVVVTIAAGLAHALTGAATVTGWDGERLTSTHEALAGVAPGDSPRIVLVDTDFDADAIRTVDWLARRHGVDATAYQLRMLRFGSERLMDVSRAYPAPDPAAAAPDFFAAVAAAAKANGSTPPPRIPTY